MEGTQDGIGCEEGMEFPAEFFGFAEKGGIGCFGRVPVLVISRGGESIVQPFERLVELEDFAGQPGRWRYGSRKVGVPHGLTGGAQCGDTRVEAGKVATAGDHHAQDHDDQQ